MKVSFTLTKRGKEVTFRNTSLEVPEGSTYLWDFGVYTGKSDEKNPPPFTYDNEGFYVITLTVTPPSDNQEKPTSVTETVGISDSGLSTLSDSIYNLIDYYIPSNLLGHISNNEKRVYIEKWQLYIQPLVNHEIPEEDYSNEFAYSALENQLIMELAAYDWLLVGVMNLLKSLSVSIEDTTGGSSTDGSSQGNNQVKKIVTGPSEVEFFESAIGSGEDISSLTKAINSALQPGGLLDNIRSNICMLSQRLEIYLPICDKSYNIMVPKVVNRRNPGLLGGPNPKFPIKK